MSFDCLIKCGFEVFLFGFPGKNETKEIEEEKV